MLSFQMTVYLQTGFGRCCNRSPWYIAISNQHRAHMFL